MGTDFSKKNNRASHFNDDLSNEPNFGRDQSRWTVHLKYCKREGKGFQTMAHISQCTGIHKNIRKFSFDSRLRDSTLKGLRKSPSKISLELDKNLLKICKQQRLFLGDGRQVISDYC
jgi:hypothetical protein